MPIAHISLAWMPLFYRVKLKCYIPWGNLKHIVVSMCENDKYMIKNELWTHHKVSRSLTYMKINK